MDHKRLQKIKEEITGQNMKPEKTKEIVRGIKIPKHLQHLPRENILALLYLFGRVV